MTGRTRTLAWSVAVALSLLSGGPARAGDSSSASEKDAATVAAHFFRAGRAAYDREEYRAAALAFTEAYRRVPKSAAMYDAGRSWEAAHEVELAADAFLIALRNDDLAAQDADYARTHLAALSASLAIVDVRGPAGALVSVRGMERGAIPLSLHLAPGSHEIHARRRDGSDIAQSVTLAGAGERAQIAFEDVHVAVPPPPPASRPPLQPSRPTPVIAWTVLGAAGAFALGGVYTYDRFASARATFEASAGHDATVHADAERWRTTTYVLWGGAAALGALGGILFVTSPRGHTPPTTASLRVTGCGVAFVVTE